MILSCGKNITHKLYQRPVPNTLNDLISKLRGLLFDIKNETFTKAYISLVRRYIAYGYVLKFFFETYVLVHHMSTLTVSMLQVSALTEMS